MIVLANLAAGLWIDFERRLELSSLTRGEDRARTLRAFLMIGVRVLQTAVLVR